uniref:Splicing factor YJU2 n=1 Tax=Opuntia streptacantha TaxID=393608 RepID=A0A7C9CQA1_OPUST
MGERKVLNKYYPPDFDPAKIPRRRQPKNQQIKVRMMLPMSIRCSTCGNYIYKGTKFNSRKEDVIGETYLGIQIFRFYFKCTKCSAELAIKTDPQNSDYVVEAGATRNFEPWRDKDEELEQEKRKRDAEELGDAMKSLENRTLDSKREMDILAALDEMRSMKSRQATVSLEEMLEAIQRTGEEKERKLEEEDEALIKSIFHGPKDTVRRIDDEEWDDDGDDDDEMNRNETSNHNAKRCKMSEDPCKPTDALTSSSISEHTNTKGRWLLLC